jgi:ketosteroid isomerase-like protein
MRILLFIALGISAAPWQAIVAQQSKDEKAIRAQETRWRQAVTRKDTAAIKSFYTDSGIYAPDNAPAAFAGRDSVSARWSREFGAPDFRLERTPTRINVASSGDLAQEVGTYHVHLIRDGKPYEGDGNYLTSWRKVGGEWKIDAYIWNADTTGHRRFCERQCAASKKK